MVDVGGGDKEGDERSCWRGGVVARSRGTKSGPIERYGRVNENPRNTSALPVSGFGGSKNEKVESGF